MTLIFSCNPNLLKYPSNSVTFTDADRFRFEVHAGCISQNQILSHILLSPDGKFKKVNSMQLAIACLETLRFVSHEGKTILIFDL